MRLLLIDVVRTTLDETWPGVEPSIGLMYVAACLRERFGERVQVRIETLVSRPGCEVTERSEVARWLAEFGPDAVGVRCLSIGKDALPLIVGEVRAWNAACVTLAGGPYASDAPEEALRSAPVDCVVIGEGEMTAIDIVDRILRGEPFTDVRGTAHLDAERFVRNPVREPIRDLDALPYPDHSLIDQDDYANRYLTFSSRLYTPHGNVLTSRGCPFRCMYCHNILGKTFRARSADSVFAEIRYLHDELGLRDFQIIDDIFNLDLRRAKRVCDLIIDSGLQITLSFPNGVRSDVMDDELMEKLAEAGTKFMAIAIETATPRLQKLIQKNLHLDRAAWTIDRAAELDIITRGFFMLGFPTETEDEALETIRFAVDSELCGATFFTVVYFPGTPLFQLAQSMGYFADGGPDVCRDYVQVGAGPYEFSVERMTEMKRSAVAQFGFTRRRLERVLRLLPTYYSSREVDVFLMAHITSSGMQLEDIEDEWVRAKLRRHFLVHDRFSRKADFYV